MIVAVFMAIVAVRNESVKGVVRLRNMLMIPLMIPGIRDEGRYHLDL